jgi:hypothetical protein
MKALSAKNLFDRFAKYLKSIDSRLQIDIKMANDVKRFKIWVKYPATKHWFPWYYCFDMDVDLQLFFLGQNLPNRDTLVYNNVISYNFKSIFETESINDIYLLDSQTYHIFQTIGLPQSLEEISIKFDLLGI